MTPSPTPTKLADWFFRPAVRFDMDALYDGGKRTVRNTDCRTIGGRSVYSAEPEESVAVHEMAHLIDINDERAHFKSWGLVPGTDTKP